MFETKKFSVLLKKCAISLFFLVVIFALPLCSSSHSSEEPSFKYSREANEDTHTNAYGKNGNKLHNHHTHGFSDHGLRDLSVEGNEIWLYSMGSTFFISAVPFLILFVIPLDNSDAMKPRLKVLLAFASGGLLGDAFLHLIPHATHPHNGHGHSHDNAHSERHSHGERHHDHSKDITIGLWVLAGIIAFLTVEKLVRLLKAGTNVSHGHSHKDKKKIEKTNNHESAEKKNKKIKQNDRTNIDSVDISGYLNLAADFAHNFTDGLAIGASFIAGNSIGFVTTITILLHEVPHEIGDFAILIKSGCSRRKAMLLQLLTAVGALSGNVLALIGVGTDANAVPWVLPFTAGGFIYIATVSVLPELLEESTKLLQSIKEICALLTGVLLMIFITNFE